MQNQPMLQQVDPIFWELGAASESPQGESFVWVLLDRENSTLIENAWLLFIRHAKAKERGSRLHVCCGMEKYEICFSTMQKLDLATGSRRRLRRRVGEHELPGDAEVKLCRDDLNATSSPPAVLLASLPAHLQHLPLEKLRELGSALHLLQELGLTEVADVSSLSTSVHGHLEKRCSNTGTTSDATFLPGSKSNVMAHGATRACVRLNGDCDGLGKSLQHGSKSDTSEGKMPKKVKKAKFREPDSTETTEKTSALVPSLQDSRLRL